MTAYNRTPATPLLSFICEGFAVVTLTEKCNNKHLLKTTFTQFLLQLNSDTGLSDFIGVKSQRL